MPLLSSPDTIGGVLPEGLPLSVVGIAATVLIGVIYTIISRERPLTGFPIVSLGGETPKKSWVSRGRELISHVGEKGMLHI